MCEITYAKKMKGGVQLRMKSLQKDEQKIVYPHYGLCQRDSPALNQGKAGSSAGRFGVPLNYVQMLTWDDLNERRASESMATSPVPPTYHTPPT